MAEPENKTKKGWWAKLRQKIAGIVLTPAATQTNLEAPATTNPVAEPVSHPELSRSEQAVRANYQQELASLQHQLNQLAEMVDKALSQASFVLKNRHYQNLAREVIQADYQINARRYQLEQQALNFLAVQQPLLPHDLRLVTSLMELAGEMERIGDYAKGIVKLSQKLTQPPPDDSLQIAEEMADYSRKMLSRAMTAFAKEDSSAAQQIISADDRLDQLYQAAYQKLLEIMSKDNQLVDQATTMLSVLHNLERVGDRVSNICQRIIFIQTGQPGKTEPPAQ
jgi:phosphate transport system protein